MILLLVLAAAMLLRLWTLGAIGLIETDGVRYVEIARQFQRTGSPFDPLFHPLYPMGVALVEPLVGDWEVAGRLVSAAAGTAVIVPAYLLARGLLGRPAALIAAVLLAVHPALVRSSAAVLSESVYGFLLALGAWAGWRAITDRPRLLPLTGALLALAYLVRPEGALYFVAFLVLAGWRARASRGLGRFAVWAAASTVAFLLLAGPYLLYLHDALGHWTLSGKVAHNLVHDLGAPAPGSGSDVGLLVGNAKAVGRQLLTNCVLFQKYALQELFPGALVLFLLPGLVIRARERDWRRREGLLLALAVPPAATLAFHVEARVFLPVLPFLLPMVASGLLITCHWLRGEKLTGRWAAAAVLVVIVILLPFTLRPILRPDPDAATYRLAAQWIERTSAPDAIVMDRKPFVAFYSRRRYAPLPGVRPGDLARVARGLGAGLVVLDSRVLEDRPQLVPLLYTPPPPDLEVLRDFDTGRGDRLRILGVHDRS